MILVKHLNYIVMQVTYVRMYLCTVWRKILVEENFGKFDKLHVICQYLYSSKFIFTF